MSMSPNTDCGYVAVAPPKSNRKQPKEYDKADYRKRNEIDRLFDLIKEKRREATLYDKLDVMFLSFVYLALINISLHDELSCFYPLDYW